MQSANSPMRTGQCTVVPIDYILNEIAVLLCHYLLLVIGPSRHCTLLRLQDPGYLVTPASD